MANYKWKRYSTKQEKRTGYKTEYEDYQSWEPDLSRPKTKRVFKEYWETDANGNRIPGTYRSWWEDEPDGYEGSYVTKQRAVQVPYTYYEKVKSTYMDEVTSTNRSAYPDNGEQGGYWYEYAGLANQAPTITGSSTSIGNIKSDFQISYSVADPDGDDVKVQVMVDNKVIQYPMSVPLNRTQYVSIRANDYSLGNHTITVTATDSQNASATRTYYFSKTNQAPTISGSDMDLGGKFKDFSVDYIVQDADGDSVKVEIKVDGKVVQAPTTTTLGVRRYFNVPIKDYSLGRHTIEIIASDSQGATSSRKYYFHKTNSTPVISGSDMSLGAKNTGFTYTYTVTDQEGDSVTVYEKINGEITKTIRNITLGQQQSITISNEKIREMDLNAVNTIEIEATDGAATTYRRVTFMRNNMPPIISGSDGDLGSLETSLNYSYSVTDPEKDEVDVTVYLNDKVLVKKFRAVDGKSYSVSMSGLDFLSLRPGRHEIVVEAVDSKGYKATRKQTFTRVAKRLIMKLLPEKVIPTDQLANRVLISLVGINVARGASLKVEVCNNGFDTNPTWEDATAMAEQGRAYSFQNKTKKAAKAGIDMRLTIEKGSASTQSWISSWGGSFD